ISLSFFLSTARRTRRSTRFHYTTLFRSVGLAVVVRGLRQVHRHTLRDHRGHDHEDDEEHEDDVHERRDVDVCLDVALLPLLRVADRNITRLNSSHSQISYAVFCLKKKSI